MSDKIVGLLQLRKDLQKRQAPWLNYWQQLAEVLHPRRADITDESGPGQSRQTRIYDSTPIQARRGLATAIDGLVKSKTSQWFGIRASDELLNADESVMFWMEDTERRMWNAIYARPARFIQKSGEVDDDLVTFGLGNLFIGETSDKQGLVFRSIHPKDYVYSENADGQIDTGIMTFKLTAKQAAMKYGEENLGRKTKEALRMSKFRDSTETFEFFQCIKPRRERRPGSDAAEDMQFESMVIDVASEHIVTESGFMEFPIATPRWETSSGEIYPRSPGMIALPDAQTLQAMGKTLLVAGQKAVDPPLWMLDDAVIGVPRTFPGGVTIVDSESARAASGQPFGTINFNAKVPLGIEMQRDTRSLVEAAFFKNVFNLPIEGPAMTATEIIERKQEFIRTIGPVFGRLEADYIGHIVDRVFGIMFRAGRFLEPPEALQGQNIEFTFQSPIQRAKKQIEATSAVQSLDMLAPFVQAQPEIMDNFDGDHIVRQMPDVTGMPIGWLRSLEQREAIRQQRAQAAQAQQQLAAAQQASEAVRNVGTIQ